MSGKLTTSTDTEPGVAEAEEEDEKALDLRPWSWSDLPPDLLGLIVSRGLTPRDKRRVARVCKTWHSVMWGAYFFPWILYYPRRGSDPDTHFKLFDPTEPKTYSIDIPEELRGATPCFAKHGWLLLYRGTTASVFFFNPFTGELIKLPDFKSGSESLAFSGAPTSPGCVVFMATHAVGDGSSIGIHTCHPGATEWTSSTHCGLLCFPPDRQLKLVICSGLFYCLCFLGGGVGIFDPQGREWTLLEATEAAYKRRHQRHRKFTCSCDGTFAAEYRGEILGVHTCRGENPRMFKLHRRMNKVKWLEASSLDYGASFFAGIGASHAMTIPPGIIRNNIYSLEAHVAGSMQKRCISYSIDGGCRHRPRKLFGGNRETSHLLNSLWIEPPQELLPSFFSSRPADPSRKNAEEDD